MLEWLKPKQVISTEKIRLTTPPLPRPKSQQPGLSVPVPGQMPPSTSQQPGIDLSTLILRTRRSTGPHGWLGRYRNDPRSRKCWSSKSRSRIRRRLRRVCSSRSRVLSASRSELPPPPQKSRPCCHQEAKVTTIIRARMSETANFRVPLLPPPMGSRPPESLRSGTLMKSRSRLLPSPPQTRSRMRWSSRLRSCVQ